MTRYTLLAALLLATSCATPPVATTVSQEWIDALIERSYKIVPAVLKTPDKSYDIEWRRTGHSITTIALRNTKSQDEIRIRDYPHLKKAVAGLPAGSFVRYTFSDDGPDLLDLQQIRELHDLCRRNGLEFLLHEGG